MLKRLNFEDDDDAVKELVKVILDKKWISHDDVKLMRFKESCTKEPDLALALYHSCGSNPMAHVYNNESLINDTTGVCNRLKRNIQKPPSDEMILKTYHDAVRCNTSNNPVWMCASCNEIIYHGNENGKPVMAPVKELCP